MVVHGGRGVSSLGTWAMSNTFERLRWWGKEQWEWTVLVCICERRYIYLWLWGKYIGLMGPGSTDARLPLHCGRAQSLWILVTRGTQWGGVGVQGWRGLCTGVHGTVLVDRESCLSSGQAMGLPLSSSILWALFTMLLPFLQNSSPSQDIIYTESDFASVVMNHADNSCQI